MSPDSTARIIPGYHKNHYPGPLVTRVQEKSPGITRSHQESPKLTRIHQISPEVTRSHRLVHHTDHRPPLFPPTPTYRAASVAPPPKFDRHHTALSPVEPCPIISAHVTARHVTRHGTLRYVMARHGTSEAVRHVSDVNIRDSDRRVGRAAMDSRGSLGGGVPDWDALPVPRRSVPSDHEWTMLAVEKNAKSDCLGWESEFKVRMLYFPWS